MKRKLKRIVAIAVICVALLLLVGVIVWLSWFPEEKPPEAIEAIGQLASPETLINRMVAEPGGTWRFEYVDTSSLPWKKRWGVKGGENYRQARAAAVKVCTVFPDKFVKLEQTATDWREKLACAIVLERVRQKKTVRKLKDWRLSVKKGTWPRGRTSEYRYVGKQLARACRQTPMFLMERFWKGNALDVGFGRYMARACIALALARLRPKYAARALALAFDDLSFENGSNRQGCAMALISLGDAETVAELLDYFERKYEKGLEPSHVDANVVESALFKHATTEHIDLLVERGKKTKNEAFKKEIIDPLLKHLRSKQQP